MTILGKIYLWSDQGCRAAIAAIFNSIWQTNDHESANGTNFFLHSDDVLTGYRVKPSILGSAHST